MGFSIESFFRDLLEIINDKGLDEVQRDIALCELIEWQYNYAIDCGVVQGERIVK